MIHWFVSEKYLSWRQRCNKVIVCYVKGKLQSLSNTDIINCVKRKLQSLNNVKGENNIIFFGQIDLM